MYVKEKLELFCRNWIMLRGMKVGTGVQLKGWKKIIKLTLLRW